MAVEAHTCEGSGMLLEGWVTTAHDAQRFGQSEESSERQTSFTKLAVESEENGARPRADTSIGDRDEVSTEAESPRSLSPAKDFDRARRRSNVESLGEKCEVEEVLPEGRLDHPTSTEDVQYDDKDTRIDSQPVKYRCDDQEVAKSATGHSSQEPDTDFEKSDRTAQQTAGPGLIKPDDGYGASDVGTSGLQGPIDLEESER